MEFSGVWWLESDSERRPSGTLRDRGDEWELSLIGTLRNEDDIGDPSVSRIQLHTIFGECRGTQITLVGARRTATDLPGFTFEVFQGGGPRDRDDQKLEHWIASQILVGSHLPESTRYSIAEVRFTGLEEWWDFTGLAPELDFDFTGYEAPDTTTVRYQDGLELRIGAALSGRHGHRERSIQEEVRVLLRRPDGFLLSELSEQFLPAITSLLSICLDALVSAYGIELRLISENSKKPWEQAKISLDPRARDALAEKFAFDPFGALTSREFELKTTLQRWVDLFRTDPVPALVASEQRPKDRRTALVQVVNAAETLHRSLKLRPESTGSEMADRVREAMETAGGFNSQERKTARQRLLDRGPSLEQRLKDLAESLGSDFCFWFFQQAMPSWAYVSATLRNSLSHGLDTAHKIDADETAVIAVELSTRAVLQLCLLKAAGVPIEQSMFHRSSRFVSIANQRLVDWDRLAAAIRAATQHGRPS